MDLEVISDADFQALAGLIYDTTGIALSASKKALVTSRLRKHVRAHQLDTFGEYYDFVREHDAELQELINAITTNKTEFFREAVQFDDLRKNLLPRLSKERRARVWCSAASTGEEPWTLAISLFEGLESPESADVRILATDIDTAVLERARAGVYANDRLSGLTLEQRERHFRQTNAGWEVRPHLRRWVDFRQLNLIAPEWPHRQSFDAVFCRNVMIYFDHETRDQLVRRFLDYVAPGGRLYVGLSEVLHWLPDVWRAVGPSVYVPAVERAAPPRATPVRAAPKPKAAPALPRKRIIVGEVEARSEPSVLTTLLGSCVAIGLTDPVNGVGGLNHFLLPDARDVDPSRAASYGAYAIELLINEVLKAGGQRRNLEAKIFGGGRVLANMEEHVGGRNLEFAKSFLAEDGIPIVSVREGGDGGLDVAYFTATGEAFVRPIHITQLDGAARDERAHRRTVAKPVPATDDGVELF
ncbi:MAG: CheR family methyltransferase [Archangium sp.]